jgi:hypothetical protein
VAVTQRSAFIDGLVARGGWDEHRAAEHFDESMATYEIEDAVAFVLEETDPAPTGVSRRARCAAAVSRRDDRLVQIVK